MSFLTNHVVLSTIGCPQKSGTINILFKMTNNL